MSEIPNGFRVKCDERCEKRKISIQCKFKKKEYKLAHSENGGKMVMAD